eukprot:SAG31_NODE_11267_length_1048_cov_1.015806_2_plen_128_part_01
MNGRGENYAISNCLPPDLHYVDVPPADVCSGTSGASEPGSGPSAEPEVCYLASDLNQDNTTNILDLLSLLGSYGCNCYMCSGTSDASEPGSGPSAEPSDASEPGSGPSAEPSDASEPGLGPSAEPEVC